MIQNEKIVKLVKELNIKNFHDYLISKKWNEYKSLRDDIKIYQYEIKNKLYQITIPQNHSLFDYSEELMNSIRILSDIEKISVENLLMKISNVSANIIKFRIDNQNKKVGSAGLFDFLNISEQIKQMIKTTAMSELFIVNEWINLSNEEINKYLDSCEVGQTEIGSYIMPIILPINSRLNKSIEQIGMFPSHSYGHVIAHKMLKNMDTIIVSLERNVSEEEISNELEEKRILSSFCDAFLKIIPNKTNDYFIEIIPEWSPLIEYSLPDNKIIEINTKIDKIKLKKVIDNLKKIAEGEEKIIGRVKELKSHPILEERCGGTAHIAYLDKSNKKKVISTVLNDVDYKKAIEAHLGGKMIVGKGTVITKKNSSTLECKSFEIMD